jgi:hypothetical protein
MNERIDLLALNATDNKGGLDRHKFAALVEAAARADEREACAKVADTISDKYGWGHYGKEVDTADEIAAAIRARGNT